MKTGKRAAYGSITQSLGQIFATIKRCRKTADERIPRSHGINRLDLQGWYGKLAPVLEINSGTSGAQRYDDGVVAFPGDEFRRFTSILDLLAQHASDLPRLIFVDNQPIDQR